MIYFFLKTTRSFVKYGEDSEKILTVVSNYIESKLENRSGTKIEVLKDSKKEVKVTMVR